MRKFIMALVALGFLTAPMLMLNGCGNITGDTANYDQSGQDHSYMFVEGDRAYGEGTYLFCTDANCSVTNADNNSDNSTGEYSDEADAIVGVYDPNYNQVECESAGFFYCTVSDACLNQRVDAADSSCGG